MRSEESTGAYADLHGGRYLEKAAEKYQPTNDQERSVFPFSIPMREQLTTDMYEYRTFQNNAPIQAESDFVSHGGRRYRRHTTPNAQS